MDSPTARSSPSPGHRSTRRRVVVPASWGGDKRIAAEYQQEFSRRFAPRLRAGALLQRRTHPFFDENADRRRVWGRTEWRILRDRSCRRRGRVAVVFAHRTEGRCAIGRRRCDRRHESRSVDAPQRDLCALRDRAAAISRLRTDGHQNRDRCERLCRHLPRHCIGASSRCARISAGRLPHSINRCSAARAICAGFAPATPLATRSSLAQQSCAFQRRLRCAWRSSGSVSSADAGTAYDKGQHFSRSEAGEGRRGRRLGNRAAVSLQRRGRARHRVGLPCPCRRRSDLLTSIRRL